MAEDEKVLEFAKTELQSGSSQKVLGVVASLKKISLALGADKFRQLLDIIKNCVDDQEWADEVASKLAMVLGDFIDFLESSSDKATLLDILSKLCEYDETQVRQEAVSAINKIGSRMGSDSPFGKEKLVPVVTSLASNADWWAPRVSACGLVATAYKAFTSSGEDEKRKEIVSHFRKLCGFELQGPDTALENPLVRSAAALRFGDVVGAMVEVASKLGEGKGSMQAYLEDKTKHDFNVGEFYIDFLKSDHDYVKVDAVKSSAAVFRYWSLDSKLGESFEDCATDKSWRVRVAVAKVLADVLAANPSAGNLPRAKSICKKLMDDPEAEVKHAIGEASAMVAKALGESFAEDEIFPRVKALVEGVETSREKLSGVLMDMAGPLGKARAILHLFNGSGGTSLFARLCSDENTNVRLNVLNKLQTALDVVRLDGAHAPAIFETLREHAGSANWRVRHAVLLLMPKVAQVLKEDAEGDYIDKFNAKFGFKFFFCAENTEDGQKTMQDSYGKEINVLPWALDPIAQIRKEFPAVCKDVALVFAGGEPPRNSGGGKWIVDKVLPVLKYCYDGGSNKEFKDKYHQRVVLLLGLAEVGQFVPIAPLEESVQKVLAMAKERLENGNYVPSLRLMIARDLPHVAKHVSPTFLNSELLPCLDEMQKDEDPDVREFAKESLQQISS